MFFAVVIIVLVALFAPPAKCHTCAQVPHLVTVAPATPSPYNIGLEIGQQMREIIVRKINAAPDVDDASFARAKNNSKIYAEIYAAVAREGVPNSMSMLGGMAMGAGVNITDLVIEQIYEEYLIETNAQSASQCTDAISVTSTLGVVHGHNSDWTCTSAPDMAIIKTSWWTAYTHPARLPGTNFAANKWGVVFSVTTVHPLYHLVSSGIAPAFVLHSLLDARTIGDAMARILAHQNVRGGFAVQISSACESRAVSIEVWGSTVAIQRLTLKTPASKLVHFNSYHMLAVAQWESPHSRHRRLEFAQKKYANSTIKEILDDNVETDVGVCETMLTIIADGKEKKIHFGDAFTQDWDYTCSATK